MLAAMFLLAILVGVGAGVVLLVLRIAQAARPSREPTTHWMRRSGTDRRRHNLRVQVERRKSPRREEEIAGQFLADVRAGQRSLRSRRPAI